MHFALAMLLQNWRLRQQAHMPRGSTPSTMAGSIGLPDKAHHPGAFTLDPQSLNTEPQRPGSTWGWSCRKVARARAVAAWWATLRGSV